MIGLPPQSFTAADARHGEHVPRLAQTQYVGQTYGAASALLSALALTGVSASLALQAKESRAARKDSGRNHHLRLIRMAASGSSGS
ncbi:DUF6082 family protein [Microbispora sp. NPDC049633]|uniref:DUF6082 family protein n=1 Tax=Microbispora sp. NPDC049633 TaxID=3154355 RepID=UPI00344747BC